MIEFVGVVPPVVESLSERSLGSDDDREAWLEARTNVVTATEAKLLMMAPNATARKRVVQDLVDEKLNGSKFAGNHFTYWGNLREPVILAELERRYGMRGCGLLVHHTENVRHAATPDAAGVSFDGALLLAEIKTSKNDVSLGSDGFDRAGYYYQMQWQMYCAGTDRVLYVVERHNNDWSGWDLNDRSTWLLETGPAVEPLVVGWVERDSAVIARMVEFADEALSVLDEARLVPVPAESVVDDAGGLDASLVEQQGYALAADVIRARAAENAAAAEKKLAWDSLFQLGEKHGDFTASGVAGAVRYVAPVAETVEVPDEAAAVEAFPKEWASLKRARTRLAKLEADWAERSAKYTKLEERPGKPSLSVTAAKRGKKK